jgi:YVTN family beta-propeller protein
VIDEATNTVTGTIPVGSGPYGVAVDPAARTVYVTNNSDNTVSVINETTNTVTRTIPVGSDPYGVAVDPSAGTVYVTNAGDDTVSVINEATSTVTRTIPVGNTAQAVAVDPAARTVYVANTGDNTVSVIDEATSTVTRTIPVGSGPVGVAVDPATRTVFVINTGDNTVSVINEATNTVFETVPVDSSGPVGVAADPATQTVYVANWGYVGNPRSRTVSVLSRMALTTVTTVTSSPNPSTFGRAVTLTAAVTSADGGGTVEFKDGAAGLRGCAARPLRLAAGHYQATCTIGRLPAGKDTITAVYAGDTAYATSTSSPLTQTVRRPDPPHHRRRAQRPAHLDRQRDADQPRQPPRRPAAHLQHRSSQAVHRCHLPERHRVVRPDLRAIGRHPPQPRPLHRQLHRNPRLLPSHRARPRHHPLTVAPRCPARGTRV